MLSQKALAATAAAQPVYIEDVFSTYLYTGNGSTQTITNGIDLSGEGGLMWFKSRNNAAQAHQLVDSARGNYVLVSNSTVAQSAIQNSSVGSPTITLNSNGFTFNGDLFSALGDINYNIEPFVSWTFRKQPKFFDVVTWTGNGTGDRTISHALGSTPGCMLIKATSAVTNWYVYHRSLANPDLGTLYLNATNAETNLDSPGWNVSSTTFNARASASLNDNGTTYVAYLFAHDAGGFGDSGSESVIKCGSFTVNSSGNATIDLGWEPQYLLMKQTSTTGSWFIQDVMRGQTADSGYARLLANTSDAETTSTTGFIRINATGFSVNGATGLQGDLIYIAIRRGPMKTPTTGTSVFSPVAYSGNNGTQTITAGFPVDAMFVQNRNKNFTYQNWAVDRLRAVNKQLYTDLTDAEGSDGTYKGFDNNIGLTFNASGNLNGSGANYISWFFRRAPGFFDVVCYTGTGANRTVTHNLGVAPELMIVKRRNNATEHWNVYNSASGATKYMRLNQTLAASTASVYWNDTAPTSSVFTVGTDGGVNASGGTYVAYLFASVAGVSKVGSYTGTGTTLQVNCGFTGGARFVLIKRTDSTGDWYVWDSARGIVAGNDPYLVMNGTQPIAEVTNTDYVDTYSAGFEISSTAPAAINANGGTYIFLAVS